MTAQVADLSECELLDEVDVLRHRQMETGVQLLRLVAEFARQHGEGTVDPVQAKRPGREGAVRLGGEGTPLVAEFACSVLAARLGLSAYAGGRLVADVLDLGHRLPVLWAGVQALEVSEGHARYVASKTRNLTPEEAAYVDARVAPSADGRLSWTRFETLVEASIIAADPETAAAREESTARESFAKATRSTEHGMRGFYVRADFATIARIDATVAFLARALQGMGDTSSLDQRRVKAVLIMANPVQAVNILAAYAAWQRGETTPRDSTESETTEGQASEGEKTGPTVSTEAQRFDPTQAAELLDEAKLLPAEMLSRLIAAATAGALLMLDAGAPALAGPDPTYPTARFTLNKTTTYMYTPHPGDDPVGRGSFQVTTSDVADDETPSDDIQIEVTTGEGSEVYPWPAYCRTMACGLGYGTPGTFHPTMRLTDGNGHVTTIELPALTVLRDKIAPVARLRMPAPRQRHRVSAWRVIRGTAADAGIDGTHSQLWVLQKRRGFWRCYDGYTRVWHKGLRTEAATWTRLGPRINPVDNVKVGGNRWRTPRIRGLTRGPLVVRLFAADQNSNEFGPRKVAWIRLTRR